MTFKGIERVMQMSTKTANYKSTTSNWPETWVLLSFM